MSDWRTDKTLPGIVRASLGALTDGLNTALGGRLRAVLLHGPVVRGDEFHAPTTTVNLMIVVKEMNVATLDVIGPLVLHAQRELQLTTMILTEEDVNSSADVFPAKFIDAKNHHRLLHGEDPLAALEISEDHLRLRCEQELKNLMLRLRMIYVRTAKQRRALLEALSRTGNVFVDQLRTLLRLREGEAPSRRADVVEQVTKLGLDKRVLEELLAIDRGRYAPNDQELKALVDRFLTAVTQAAGLADAHEVGGGA